MKMIFTPGEVGWRLGRAHEPRGGQLWVPWDRTTGVIGPQGSGKTLDLLTPALLGAPGSALVSLTKVDDLLLSFPVRSREDRPCLVLDPFGLAAGLPELVWDPVAGCVDSIVAERRAKAFTAGTVKGAVAGGYGDDAARFYAAEAAKVLQAFFHAAALTGRTLDHVLRWVANPAIATEPTEILREHPHAAPYWHGLLHGALHGDDRTAGNTITTVQQAMSLFFQDDLRRRCVPGGGRPATDVAELIRRRGTIYLLGREDPYASASPLMTAVAEHVLDTALMLAGQSGWGRLCPPMLACLDELPSTAPLPTLRTRMANERALGVSFIYAAQTWRQLAAVFGEQEARALFGLTNVLVMFGGSKDGGFNQEISDLVGQTRVSRTHWQTGTMAGRSFSGEDMAIIRPEEIRRLGERRALVIAENGKPIIARLSRCIDGKTGAELLAGQAGLRGELGDRFNVALSAEARAAAALVEARCHGIVADPGSYR
jgi:type IV secretion system protein VirD4